MGLPVRRPAVMSSAGFLRDSLVLIHALPCWPIGTAVRPHGFRSRPRQQDQPVTNSKVSQLGRAALTQPKGASGDADHDAMKRWTAAPASPEACTGTRVSALTRSTALLSSQRGGVR